MTKTARSKAQKTAADVPALDEGFMARRKARLESKNWVYGIGSHADLEKADDVYWASLTPAEKLIQCIEIGVGAYTARDITVAGPAYGVRQWPKKKS